MSIAHGNPSFDSNKYRAFGGIQLSNRTWPDQQITQAPIWGSVDLRDGNQALINPMNVDQKKALFALLVKVGFKEIEVGFPAASQPDYDFVRWLIEANQVPKDVTLQVLTQARDELIEKTFAALKGAHRAIVHVYNSTNPTQRDKVFGLDRTGIVDIAVRGARKVKAEAARHPETEWVFQYSPESFSQTELDFAVEVVDAVVDVFEATPERPVIINLPATVEAATPNVFADQIEWFLRHVARRDSIILSVHTHNDRGCAVAAAELAVMAGAQRVEGTLLGNGERTGNMDVVTMAMNLYSQGVNPGLNLADIDEIATVVKACTDIPVHPRHPYVGELVYTAFSGSHQDAIKKCLAVQSSEQPWDVAYLPIDPADLGRSYEAVIRVNSQSGKGGVAFTMEHNYGLKLPRWLQIHFSSIVQRFSESHSREVSAEEMRTLFDQHYTVVGQDTRSYWHLGTFDLKQTDHDEIVAHLHCAGEDKRIVGSGQGAMEAFADAMRSGFGHQLHIQDYSEHALGSGTDAEAATYIQARIDGTAFIGVGIHRDIVTASLNAMLSIFNQAQAMQQEVA